MESNISTPANQGVSRAEMRRYHQMIGLRYGNEVTSCTCELPERPDNWSDGSWQKYKLIMARLPCKTCGWAGGSGFAIHPPGLFEHKESVRVAASNLKNPEGKAGQQKVSIETTTPETPSTESVVSTSSSISTSEDLVYAASGLAKNDGEETNAVLVVYEM